MKTVFSGILSTFFIFASAGILTYFVPMKSTFHPIGAPVTTPTGPELIVVAFGFITAIIFIGGVIHVLFFGPHLAEVTHGRRR